MAFLFEQNTGSKYYLRAHHSFGRFVYSVDTLISDPSVSKIHVIIEWHDNQWWIRDLSRNGTWLNNTLLSKEEASVLKLNYRISLTADGENDFIVKDLSAPCDLLIPCIDTDATNAIELKPYHLLPSEEAPEIVMIFDQSTASWHVEHIKDENINSLFLEDNSYVEFSGQRWQLKLSHLEKGTQIQNTAQHSIDNLTFTFELSQDEEITHLKVTSPHKIIDFDARIHHYLTLNLARYKVNDMKRGIKKELQGWVDTKRLCRDLGGDIYQINLQIHRVRKQFSELLSDFLDAGNIIERRKGQVRFIASEFEIYKGCQLESVIKNDQIICQK